MLLTFSSDKSSPLSTHLFLWKGFDWFDLQKHTQSIRSSTQLVGIVTSCFIFSAGTGGLLSGKITKTSSLIGCSLDPAMNTIILYELVAGVRREIKNTHTDAL